MKSLGSPRRLYSTHGTVAFCYKGVLFAPAKASDDGEHLVSALRTALPVTVVSENEAKTGLIVKQRAAHAKGVTETFFPLFGDEKLVND